MPDFVPRQYQSIIIDRIVAQARTAIFAGMGMGKTSSTLFAIDYLQTVEGMGPALILAPLRVAASTWPQEASKWDNLTLDVLPIVGDAKILPVPILRAPCSEAARSYRPTAIGCITARFRPFSAWANLSVLYPRNC